VSKVYGIYGITALAIILLLPFADVLLPFPSLYRSYQELPGGTAWSTDIGANTPAGPATTMSQSPPISYEKQPEMAGQSQEPSDTTNQSEEAVYGNEGRADSDSVAGVRLLGLGLAEQGISDMVTSEKREDRGV